MDASRGTQWDKWKEFGAAQGIYPPLLDELIEEGHRPLPTQWIETDKNGHKKVEARKKQIEHVPEMKSILVACGQYEDTTGVRSDSPTADVEGLNLVASFAACEKFF